MAEIKNYTLNFGSGRTLRVLNFAVAKLAFAEIERCAALRNAVCGKEKCRG
jgi:hypothetical protein